MAKLNPSEFIKEVRQEAAKVTWPTRKEVFVTSAMVFVMVTFAAVFFLVVDWLAGMGVGFVLGLWGR